MCYDINKWFKGTNECVFVCVCVCVRACLRKIACLLLPLCFMVFYVFPSQAPDKRRYFCRINACLSDKAIISSPRSLQAPRKDPVNKKLHALHFNPNSRLLG